MGRLVEIMKAVLVFFFIFMAYYHMEENMNGYAERTMRAVRAGVIKGLLRAAQTGGREGTLHAALTGIIEETLKAAPAARVEVTLSPAQPGCTEGTLSIALVGFKEVTLTIALPGCTEGTVSTILAKVIPKIMTLTFHGLQRCIWNAMRAKLVAWGMEPVVSTLDLIAPAIVEQIMIFVVSTMI